jgi:hypothetical protein
MINIKIFINYNHIKIIFIIQKLKSDSDCIFQFSFICKVDIADNKDNWDDSSNDDDGGGDARERRLDMRGEECTHFDLRELRELRPA